MYGHGMLTLALISFNFVFIQALVGYDCGGQSLNVTTLSLCDVGKCEIPDLEPTKDERPIRLLQLADFESTDILQCKVEIDRTIYYCGMHSHVSIVHNGRKQYLLDISHELCKQMQLNGMFNIGYNSQITGLKRNATDSRSITLAGSVGTDGACSGSQYSDPYGTWDKVVVQANVKITLRNYLASIKISSNELILQSGLHCKVPDGHCLDIDGSQSFWLPLPEDSCQFNSYDILYEGIAIRLRPKQSTSGPTIYTVTTRETTFALAQTTSFSICGYRILKTEHPKLFILETKKNQPFKIRTRISVNNLDIFTYVNSKFIYVEKHIRTQMTQLYTDIIQQKCALEQQVLKNALALATVTPDEVSSIIMKKPGYMASVSGEALHIVKCVPVETKLRETAKCYKELPVTYQNASYFLTPKSRILIKHATEKECSRLLPTMYKIDNVWYSMTPHAVRSLAPPVIQPLTQPKWHYINAGELATSGIYSQDDLDKLRNHLMFPIEKPAMLNTIARGAMGENINPESISMFNLLDEKSLQKIAESTGEKLWSGFLKFGSASAGIMGIFLILRAIKLVVDTVIHGYTLHSIYGWSLHILGAVWSSLAHLLVQMGHRRSQTRERLMDVEIAEPQPRQPSPQAGTSHEDQHEQQSETVKLKKTVTYSDLRMRLDSL